MSLSRTILLAEVPSRVDAAANLRRIRNPIRRGGSGRNAVRLRRDRAELQKLIEMSGSREQRDTATGEIDKAPS